MGIASSAFGVQLAALYSSFILSPSKQVARVLPFRLVGLRLGELPEQAELTRR